MAQAVKNRILFRYVLSDVWYSSAENMKFIKEELHKHFVMPLKTNHRVSLSKSDKKQGKYKRLDVILVEGECVLEIYLEGIEFPLSLVKQVFTNEDGSIGILYLVTNDQSLMYEQIVEIYQKRWKIEDYHKSLKQNESLCKLPTETVNSQTNHFFAALLGYVKLEMLKICSKQNHFVLKAELYIQALGQSFSAWQLLKPF